MSESTDLIYHIWYVAAASSQIARGETLAKTILGQQVLLGRTNEDAVFALRDFCPHRGIPLRYGRFDGKEIECCYHGWKFNCEGKCTSIPSLTPEDNVDISRIKAAAFPCREQDGLIWVYIPAPKTRVPEQLPDIPASPAPIIGGYRHVESVLFPCNIDHAVIGLMDPSHGPFVHASWWWRSARSMHVKEKKFAPTPLGFKMVAHKPSSNSRAYKILGLTNLKTEISFSLPSLRTEFISTDGGYIVLLTALTPIDHSRTQLHQFFYSNLPLTKWLYPLVLPFGKAFIRQDLEIVKKQQEGLSSDHPSLMLLGDADQQALWYFKLKKDFLSAQENGTPFENRVPEKILRWKS
ncbi:MAG: aromatic ring-hydroxylating dioxygenase subunit alpha [Rickettsiales bacterium]|nr:aromatic ring-hydroxylating dioxygenase subunit alpha [Rickettsiales bacterium]